MTIAFFSNFLNHHQVHVADELYQLTNGKYIFVEVMEMPEWLKKKWIYRPFYKTVRSTRLEKQCLTTASTKALKGDFNWVTAQEVENLMKGDTSGRVKR